MKGRNYLWWFLGAVLIVSPLWPAHAGNKPQPSNSSASAGAVANSGSYAKSQSQSASLAGATANVTGVSAVGKGGESASFSEGGAAESISEGGAASANNGGVSVDTDVPRQAPSVGLVVPQSDLMGCTKGFGLGGSRATGSAVLGWSWLQRDCYAFRRFEMLAGLGEKDAAAKAYCSRKMHWSDFGDKDKCEAVIVQSLIDIDTAREVAEVKKQIPTTSPIQKWLKLSNTKR